MKRHPVKHLPKPVRRLKEALARLGVADLTVEVSKVRYVVSWKVSGVAMHIGVGLSSSFDFEQAWQAVRRLFRQHHLAVPA